MKGKILTVANGITAFRVVLFAGFVWMLFRQDLLKASMFFVAAWGLDAIDGYFARLFNQASDFGSQLDKFVDRMIIGLGILFLIRTNFLPPESLFILTKDFALLPALTLHAMKNEPMKEAGSAGKIMTFLQGLAVAWLLLGWSFQLVVIAVVGLFGAAVAWQHLKKIHTEN